MKSDITPSESKVLTHIALNGPSTGYTAWKRMNLPEKTMSEKTVYVSLKKLLDKGLLSVSVIGETRALMPMKEYSLTVLGLSLVLDRTKPEEYRPIIERWAELVPLVTGTWNIFIKGGVEDRALRLLRIAASLVLNDVSHGLMNLGHSGDFVELFSHYFYAPDLEFATREEDQRWIKACDQDQGVHDYLTGKLTEIIRDYDTMKSRSELMLMMLQGKDKKKKTDPQKR